MNILKKPILMIAAVIICLAMVRLGFWQLDRASQKQAILQQSQQLASQARVNLDLLVDQVETSPKDLRFRQVSVSGKYLSGHTIFIDNQVVESKVGYWVITPFQLARVDKVVMVNRGWVSVGESRDLLPDITTPETDLVVNGRLNMPPAQPPLWNDDYAVNDGQRWQYLPIDEFASQTQLDVLPLVVELAPAPQAEASFVRQWPTIDDEWVGKHKAYAVQWFSMAAVFFIACLILLLRSFSKAKED